MYAKTSSSLSNFPIFAAVNKLYLKSFAQSIAHFLLRVNCNYHCITMLITKRLYIFIETGKIYQNETPYRAFCATTIKQASYFIFISRGIDILLKSDISQARALFYTKIVPLRRLERLSNDYSK